MFVAKRLTLAMPAALSWTALLAAQQSSTSQDSLSTTPTPVARIALSPSLPTVAVNDSIRLEAKALDAAGRPVPQALIIFQAAGPAQANIDSAGWVRAGAVGDVPIIVTALVPGTRPYLERLAVRVVPSPAQRIEIGPVPPRLAPGQRVQLAARVLSAEGDVRGDTVTWRSSAPAVARVTRQGILEARGPGRATITASAGVRGQVAVEVAGSAPASLTIEPLAPRVKQGDVIRFTVTPRDKAGRAISGLTPAWSFGSGEGRIDDDGAFVAYEPGTYVVTAALGGRSATATVTVTRREVRRPATVVGSVVRKAYPTAEVWLHPNGRIAYLGTHLGGDRLYTIDVSNPAQPVIVDSVQANTRLINDIMTDAAGKVMVFTREGAADRKNGIVICTLEDPLHPKPVAEFTEGVTAGVHSAFIYTQPKYGTHVYLTNDGTGALHIIDINDPTHPKEVGRWQTPRVGDYGRSLHDVDVQDGLLYASWWHDGLVILDIGKGIKGGSPSNPQLVSQFKYDLDSLYRQVAETDGTGFIRGTHTAWRHKNYVFVADEVFGVSAGSALFRGGPSRAYGRLHVVDVSNIDKPKEVAWYEPEYGGVHNVWVAGDTLYMGAYNAGFLAFDISGELRGDLRAQGREIAQVSPTDSAGFLPNAPMTWGVVVKNNLAYVNDFNNGLFIVRLEPRREDVKPPLP